MGEVYRAKDTKLESFHETCSVTPCLVPRNGMRGGGVTAKQPLGSVIRLTYFVAKIRFMSRPLHRSLLATLALPTNW
jgi:hypothetical protein